MAYDTKCFVSQQDIASQVAKNAHFLGIPEISCLQKVPNKKYVYGQQIRSWVTHTQKVKKFMDFVFEKKIANKKVFKEPKIPIFPPSEEKLEN